MILNGQFKRCKDGFGFSETICLKKALKKKIRFLKMKNLLSVTTYLEKEVNRWNESYQITSHIKKMMAKNMVEDDQQKVVWEIDALSFNFSRGEIRPMFSQTSQDGKEVFSYPSLANFPLEAFEYFKKRAEQTQNLFLNARYFIMLWNAPKGIKRNEYAHKAIDSLLASLNSLKVKSLESWHDRLEMFRCSTVLSYQINRYRADDIKKIAELWIADSFSKDVYLKLSIAEFIADYPQIWKPNDLTTVYEAMEKVMDYLIAKPDTFNGERAGLLGCRLASKIARDQKSWFNKLGELGEAFATRRMDDKTRIIPCDHLRKAMYYYQQAGNKTKVKEVGVRYQGLVKELGLQEVSIPFESKYIKALWDWNKIMAENLLKRSDKEIFDYLSVNQQVFPRISWLKTSAEQRNPDFMGVVTLLSFDINKNLGKRKRTDLEKDQEYIFEQYGLYIGLHVAPLLQMIFSNGILQNKINHNTLIQYFLSHSWLGQDLEESSSSGNSRQYNWLGVLAPALLEYFVQKEASLKSPNAFTNYVLCIDSLTLKFEGILRDFAKRSGTSTLIPGRDGQMREAFTEDLLAMDEIKAMFGEDDLLFFRFVFTSAGNNLRNDIAHCFFRFQNYREEHFLLVLAAILRFAKYQVVKE